MNRYAKRRKLALRLGRIFLVRNRDSGRLKLPGLLNELVHLRVGTQGNGLVWRAEVRDDVQCAAADRSGRSEDGNPFGQTVNIIKTCGDNFRAGDSTRKLLPRFEAE